MPTPNWFKWRNSFNTTALQLPYISLQEAERELADAKEKMNHLTGNPQEDAEIILNVHRAHLKVEESKRRVEHSMPQA